MWMIMREIKLCCPACGKTFIKNSDKSEIQCPNPDCGYCGDVGYDFDVWESEQNLPEEILGQMGYNGNDSGDY
jgi:hypothetical protein